MGDPNHESRALDRVRRTAGDLFVALDYPGGPKQLYRDLVATENRSDRQSERASFAVAVLNGDADDWVLAWCRGGADGDALCDHCDDLSARFLRAARDRAQAERSRYDRQLGRALHLIRRALRGMLIGGDAYDPDALLTKLAEFFGLKEDVDG
jgi:hypothetical protein